MQNDCIASTDVTVAHANGLPWITIDYKLTASAVKSRGDNNEMAKASENDGYVWHYVVLIGTWKSNSYIKCTWALILGVVYDSIFF